jgi:hypothetical protein
LQPNDQWQGHDLNREFAFMKNLANAAICGVFHFEFASEDDIDPDTAANAMEEIFFHLRKASAKEKQALVAALSELKAEAKAGKRKNKKELVKFYDTFMDDLGNESDEQ